MKKSAFLLAALLLISLFTVGCKSTEPTELSASASDTPELAEEQMPASGTDLPEEVETGVPAEEETTEPAAEEAEPQPVPETTAYTDWRDAIKFASREEAFLDALANDGRWQLAWNWPYMLAEGESAGNFYLVDIDADGTDELLSDSFVMDYTNWLLYDWNADGSMTEVSLGLIDWKETDALLVQKQERTYYDRSTGTTTQEVFDFGDGRLAIDLGLVTMGPDYWFLPEAGSLSKLTVGDTLTLEFTQYHLQFWGPEDQSDIYNLLRLRDPATGEVWYSTMCNGNPLEGTAAGEDFPEEFVGDISEEAYLALEQRILSDTVRVLELGAKTDSAIANLPHVSAGKAYTIFELVDRLGGFDERSEWAKAKEALETYK